VDQEPRILAFEQQRNAETARGEYMQLSFDKLEDKKTKYTLKHKGRVLLFDGTYKEVVEYIYDKQPASFSTATSELGYTLHQNK
jgi:predicted RNA-binding protein YlxR (DUF448 family)